MAARPFTCPFCQYTATTASNMSKHRQRHAPERAFPCDAPGCGRAFLAAMDLARHRRTHLGALACPHACGYTAAKRTSLTGHIKQCPAGVGLPPPPALRTTCGLMGCTYSSTRATCVRDHQKRMHDPAKGNALACMRCDFTSDCPVKLLVHVRMHSGKARGNAKVAAAAAAAAGVVAADELAGFEE